MLKVITKLLKISIYSSLFLLFLFVSGLPSWGKYKAKNVFVMKKKISLKDFSPPAVTFCAFTPSDLGWKMEASKNNTKSTIRNAHHSKKVPKVLEKCEFVSVKDVFDCVDKNTYNLTETVSVELEDLSGKPLNIFNSSAWITHMRYAYKEKCHTLREGLKT